MRKQTDFYPVNPVHPVKKEIMVAADRSLIALPASFVGNSALRHGEKIPKHH